MQLISIGYPQLLTQNVIYALPGRRCRLFCDTAGAALEQSNTAAFSVDINMSLTDGMEDVAGGFIRSTAADALVCIKPY